MPPLILYPIHNGSTQGASNNFNPTNEHGNHGLTPITQWKVTVTTGQSNGGTLITGTTWSSQPIAACLVSNLPANNNYYWCQIVYQKPVPPGGTWVSTSNKFQSRP